MTPWKGTNGSRMRTRAGAVAIRRRAGVFCGVTSGGMGEVMIPAVTFADAESITYVR
jgi:hypothetical protein